LNSSASWFRRWNEGSIKAESQLNQGSLTKISTNGEPGAPFCPPLFPLLDFKPQPFANMLDGVKTI
jgi:hypothetical protein